MRREIQRAKVAEERARRAEALVAQEKWENQQLRAIVDNWGHRSNSILLRAGESLAGAEYHLMKASLELKGAMHAFKVMTGETSSSGEE